MKLTVSQRKVAAELFVGLAVCGAAYYFAVQPLKRELQDLRTKIRAAQAKDSIAAPPDPAKVAALFESIRIKSAAIAEQGEIARSEASMFARLNELASKFSVRIDELRSTGSSAAAGAHAPAAPSPAPAPPPDPAVPPIRDTRTTYEFTARGAYADVAAFLGAIGSDLGYAVVRGVRLVPTGEATPNQLAVTIQTEHFEFDVAAMKRLASTELAPVTTGGAP